MAGDEESVDTVLGALARAAPRPPPTVLPAGTQLGGRYTVVGLLGRGGMGAVYRATDAVLGKDLALKFVDDIANVERLRDEVALAHKVTHRNVCRTYDLERIDDRWVVKMELVEGQSLAERITAGGPLAIAEVIAIGRQIADGLDAAHERGVVHRDLKPHNVMLEHGTGRAVLTDFGLARADLQPGGSGVGTPGYMAPEQAHGDGIDRRADVYSFGCVLCAMLAGRVTPATPPDPRARADAPAWLVRHVERLVDPDRDLRPWRATLAPPRKRWAVIVPAFVAVAVIAGVVLLSGRAPAPWRPTLRDVGHADEYTFQPVFSPDGSRIAYASNRGGPWRIYVETLRDGRSVPIGPHSLSVVNPQWARDGTSITCETYAQSTASTHWLQLPLVDGADGTRIAEQPARPCGPRSLTVRPNGQLLLREVDGREREVVQVPSPYVLRSFACDRAGLHAVYALAIGPQVPELWFVTLDGGAPRKLDARGWHPTFHPDGRSVITALERDGRQNLWELPVDGSAASQLTFGEGPDHSPDVSPDGTQLAFISGELLWTHSRIYAYRLPGGGGMRKLAGRRVSFIHMMVARDGAHLIAEAQRDATSEIVVVATDGSGERVLASGHAPALTHDGDHVVFATGQGPSVIQIMPVSGGSARTLATLRGSVRQIEIDEQRVAHVWVRGEGAWRIPLAGGEPVRETTPPWLYISPAPVGGWRIAFKSNATVDAYVLAPGMALDDPGARVVRDVAVDGVSWVPDGTAVTYIVDHTVHELTVATGRDDVLLELPQSDWNSAVLSRDGNDLYVAMGVAHNRTLVITNFGDRPRP